MNDLTVVEYGRHGLDVAGQQAIRSRYGFEETVARLKQAIAAADLWLIHEIDPQMLVRKGGYAILATRQLLYFHPRYLARLLQADSTAIVEVPLKLVIMELPAGEVVVRSPDLTAAWQRYAGLADLGRELAGLSHQLLGAVAERPPQ